MTDDQTPQTDELVDDEPEQHDELVQHDEPETFGREYVQELRDEAKRRREELRDEQTETDRLRRALWEARVTATGRLTDPTDAPFDPDRLDDVDAAVDALLARKPHLARRVPRGDVGQHDAEPGGAFSLLSAMRGM